jgi:hypothetical protein
MPKQHKYNLRKRKRDDTNPDIDEESVDGLEEDVELQDVEIYDAEDDEPQRKRRRLEKDLFPSVSSSGEASSDNNDDMEEDIEVVESGIQEDNEGEEDSDGGEYNPVIPVAMMELIGMGNSAAAAVKKIVEEIDKDEPTIFKIVNTPMNMEDRKNILQLYEIYRQQPCGTVEAFEMRKKLIGILNHLSKIDYDQRSRIDEEASKIPKITPSNAIYEMKEKIVDMQTSMQNKAELMEMLREYSETDMHSQSGEQIRERLNFALSLPYMKRSPPLMGTFGSLNELCIHVRKVLDEELYGMEQVKDELISVIVNKYKNPSSRLCVALKGEPGIGKTDICRAFAKAIGRPFELIALGSITDATALTGSMNWYVGSAPGLVLQTLRRFKVCDGIVLYDEVDKIMERDKSVENAMKDITDYTKNNHFRDTHLPELTHDISEMWPFFTLNSDDRLDPVLKNRLIIIPVPSYSSDEIVTIMTDYLLPKALVNFGMDPRYTITREGCLAIMEMTNDKSIRQVDGNLRKVLSKINTLMEASLPDGSMGGLKLSYSCSKITPDNKVIDRSVVKDLLSKGNGEWWKNMYA